MKTIIGLAGVKTCGKSTTANIIKDILGGSKMEHTILESALADKLKNVCAEVFGLERIQFDAQELKEVPFETPKVLEREKIEQILTSFNVEVSDGLMNHYHQHDIEGMLLDSPRKIAQIVGTEVLRAAGDQDIHCKNMPLNENGVTIVSDLRFPNEFEYFSNLEGAKFVPLYIQRNEAEKHVTKDSHPSETSVFLFSDKCVKINNNGSLLDLMDEIGVALLKNGLLETSN